MPFVGKGMGVEVEAIPEYKVVSPGMDFDLAICFRIPREVHIYADPPGQVGLPTTVQLLLPRGIELIKFSWPSPDIFKENGMVSYGYTGNVRALAKLHASHDIDRSKKCINSKVDWLACGTNCVPGSVSLNTCVTVDSASVRNQNFFKGDWLKPIGYEKDNDIDVFLSKKTWFLFSLAFLGGLILNLMPCVLPMIGIKILSFMKQSQEDKTQIRLHGLFFSMGIIVVFLILGGVLLFIRAVGIEAGWGFQLQNEPFVVFLSLLFWIIALNFLGIWEIPSISRLGELRFFKNLSSIIRLPVGVEPNETANKRGFSFLAKIPYGSLFSGMMVSIVATPCTGPFMGTALGVALISPPLIAMMIFFGLALGLASPFLILSFFPDWVKGLPRPGVWMERFKRICSIPLFVTTFWLLWVLPRNTASWVSGILIGLSLLIFMRDRKHWVIPAILVLSILGFLSSSLIKTPVSNDLLLNWEPFSKQRLIELRAANRTVFVNFTASWCLTCQTNKVTTFLSGKVVKRFRELNIATLEADWTKRDPSITEALRKLGRAGVPTSVIYLPDQKDPIILPELLTPDLLLKEI
ncbi:MAG: hypothetical protein A2007_06110 [Verrucomicrobia bacterium GWC2_42_7]|nr:MAG: hypothetical protein A2007_06110 [Verrucomicrobia bacterium GWC2_42_7]